MERDVMLESYFAAAKIPLRLACMDEAGWPRVLSLWYLYEEGFLYCATPQDARVATYLRADPRCAFEVAADQPPYCGVRGQALATLDADRGLEILQKLLQRYLGSVDNPLAKKLLSRPAPEVAIRLELQSTHTWNFTSRMAGSVPGQDAKICPD